MGLKQNGFRDNIGTFRFAGAGFSNGSYPSALLMNTSLTGAMRNLTAGQGITDDTIGLPAGYLAPSAWQLPQKSGAMSMRSLSESTVAAGLIPSYPMSIDLTGFGDLDATGALVVSMLAALSGSGTLSANIYGYLNMTCDLEGSGDLTGAMEGIASMACDLLGTGDIDATIAAYGNMEIDIVVTGTGLTTGNVGDAVWTYLIGGSEAQDLLAAAGSGGVDPSIIVNAIMTDPRLLTVAKFLGLK